MKSRPLRQRPRSVADIALLDFPEVRDARDEYAAFLRGETGAAPSLGEFDSEVSAAILRLALTKVKQPFDERAFARAMLAHRPVARQPETTDRVGDLWRSLAQEELVEPFWGEIEARTGARGRHPGIFGKALLFSTAMLGQSPHVNAVYERLCTDSRLQATFAWVEESCALLGGRTSASFDTPRYEQGLRQMHAVAENVTPSLCIAANVRMVREVHRLLGVEKVYLGIDGTSTPAHVPQIAAGRDRPELEAILRGRARRAGFRKLESDGRPVRRWRGYYTVALVDLATGLPIVWTIQDATADEAKALKHLLRELYLHWPEIDAVAITADGAWDEKWAAEWCLVNYGIHLVAPRRVDHRDVRFELDEMEFPRVSAYYGDGRAVCRKHGELLIRNGYEGYPRVGLAPGYPAPAGRFRLRYLCPARPSCGRLSLPMKEHWTALAYYPHALAAGDALLHAQRLALQAQRNTCETLFSALKLGSKLALSGAARTRTAKEPTVFALISLALLQRSARMLADLRIQRGLFTDELPPSLAG